jgi:hypothetical protein
MSRKHFPIEGKRICGHRRMLGSALTRRLRSVAAARRGGRPLRDDPHIAYNYVLDDLAAAKTAPSAPRPAVARHA